MEQQRDLISILLLQSSLMTGFTSYSQSKDWSEFKHNVVRKRQPEDIHRDAFQNKDDACPAFGFPNYLSNADLPNKLDQLLNNCIQLILIFLNYDDVYIQSNTVLCGRLLCCVPFPIQVVQSSSV